MLTPRIRMRTMAMVSTQWSMLYKAGVTVPRCYLTIAEQSRDRNLKNTCIRIADNLDEGATLEEALRGEAGRLPPIYVEAMSCADSSGRFDDALDLVSRYFEEWLEHYRAIVRAAAYPFFVLLAIMYGIPLARMVAMSVFAGTSEADLMRFMLRWLFDLVSFLAFLYAMTFFFRTRVGEWVWASVAGFIPPFGGIVRRYAHARFFRMLSILLGGGVAPKLAVRRAAALTGNPVIQADINRALPLLEQSATLEEALARSYLLPRIARQSIAVGEMTGRSPELFAKSAHWLHQDASHRMRNLIVAIEGTLIVLLGFWVIAGAGGGGAIASTLIALVRSGTDRIIEALAM
jgi:type II secretory pathway component PulF